MCKSRPGAKCPGFYRSLFVARSKGNLAKVHAKLDAGGVCI